jgi:magnesium-transporting ATPase (P-type)
MSLCYPSTLIVCRKPSIQMSAIAPVGGDASAPNKRRRNRSDRLQYHKNVFLACCGCKKSQRDVEAGISGEKRYGFLLDAASWGEQLYVPQDVPGTVKKIQEFGGSEAVLKALRSDPTKGIDGTDEDITQRQEQFGRNAFPEPKLHSWWSIFFETLKDVILIILMVCGPMMLS